MCEKMLKKTPEIAEICGAFIGDGWIESRKTSLYITGDITEDRPYYNEHLAKLFSKNICKIQPRELPYWSVYGLAFYKRKLIGELLELGFIPGKKNNRVRIPKWIINSKDKKILCSVLRGVFDTDGSFFCKKDYGKWRKEYRKLHHCQPRISIKVASKYLIKDIIILADKLGLEYTNPNPRKSKRSNELKTYIFEINSLRSIKNWFEKVVKPANEKHKTKYEIWKKFGFVPPFTSLDERKKILAGKINPYKYYAEVPKWSNGIGSRPK